MWTSSSSAATRSSPRTCQSFSWARRSRCTTATGWSNSRCSRSPSTRCRPPSPPRSRRTSASSPSVGRCGSPTSSLPTGVTTDIDPETTVALGQPPRVTVEEEGGGRRGRRRGCRGQRRRRFGWGRVGRGGQRRELGPAPPLCPVGAPGDAGGPARRRAGQPRSGIRREPAQCGVRHGRTAGAAPWRVVAGRKGRPGASRRRDAGRAPGGAGRSDHVHERLGVVRALARHAVRDRRAGLHRDRPRRARPAARHRCA